MDYFIVSMPEFTDNHEIIDLKFCFYQKNS